MPVRLDAETRISFGVPGFDLWYVRVLCLRTRTPETSGAC